MLTMTAHHLKLNPSKTDLSFIPDTTGPHHDLAISLGNSLITPTEDAISLGVILDGQLSFSARSSRFLLYNIQRIRPVVSQEATQLLVQSLVISSLGYFSSLLAGVPLQANTVQDAGICQRTQGTCKFANGALCSVKDESRFTVRTCDRRDRVGDAVESASDACNILQHDPVWTV
ncbi:hypothetical protein NFI96_007819, partial [Prochilodus magdalenae]